MSVLIKGIGMPKNCADCFLEDAYDGYNCRIAQKSANWGLDDRPSWCPLVEVPTPHGDLIDKKKLMKRFCGHCDGYEECSDKSMFSRAEDCFDLILIANTPTVIEAEECE